MGRVIDKSGTWTLCQDIRTHGYETTIWQVGSAPVRAKHAMMRGVCRVSFRRRTPRRIQMSQTSMRAPSIINGNQSGRSLVLVVRMFYNPLKYLKSKKRRGTYRRCTYRFYWQTTPQSLLKHRPNSYRKVSILQKQIPSFNMKGASISCVSSAYVLGSDREICICVPTSCKADKGQKHNMNKYMPSEE